MSFEWFSSQQDLETQLILRKIVARCRRKLIITSVVDLNWRFSIWSPSARSVKSSVNYYFKHCDISSTAITINIRRSKLLTFIQARLHWMFSIRCWCLIYNLQSVREVDHWRLCLHKHANPMPLEIMTCLSRSSLKHFTSCPL